MRPQEVLEFAKKNDAKQLDLRFTDIPSLQHHVSYPISELEDDNFEEGFGMDGSSIRGWAAIHESDMLLIPDPDHRLHGSLRRDPHPGDVRRCEGSHHQAALRARPALDRAEGRTYLKNSGVADTAYFGAEAEFFIFDNISFDQNQHSGFYFIDAEEGPLEFGPQGRTTSAIARATRKATSRCRPRITIRICAARWCRP